MAQHSPSRFYSGIKGKLTLISVIIVFSFALIAIMLTVSIQGLTKTGRIYSAVESLKSDMLILRRNEKDFLSRKKLSYYQKFQKNKENLDQDISFIADHMADIKLDLSELDSFQLLVNTYGQKLESLVEQQVSLGLDHSSGILGDLRASVHAAEQDINTANNLELLAGMLMLRRNEKDFLQRRDLKYQKKFEKNYQLLLNSLNNIVLDTSTKTAIEHSLVSYQTQFNTLIKGYEVIGLDHKTGLHGELRNSVHEAEAFLETILTQSETLVKSKESGINFILAAFFIVIVVVLLIIQATARSILKPISQLVESIQSVTESCNFSHRSKLDNAGEIGQIATALDGFYSTLQSSVNQTNRVMNAVSTGDFSERANDSLNGDLESLRIATNESADSVERTMTALTKVMHALKNGNFKERMDVKVEKVFRENVDSAMQTMDLAIAEISRTMESVSNGEFSTRITAELPGELDSLKSNINESLSNLDQAVSEIVEVSEKQQSGDLTSHIAGEYKGKLGKLKNSVNETKLVIENVVSEIRDSASMVFDTSGEISNGNEVLAGRAKQHAIALKNTAASLEDVTGTVHKSAEMAQEANNQSINTRSIAENGGRVVRTAIDAMADINNSSARISEIINVIDEIAFQTNLLALNASVEAARAGEQGRGFAVVATEVGLLAGRSATAAKEIKELITDSVDKVKTGADLVNESGATLDEIVTGIQKVSNLVSTIASATQEQSVRVDSINSSVREMDECTRQNSGLAEKALVTSAYLSEKAQKMHELLSFFKVSAKRMPISPTTNKLTTPNRNTSDNNSTSGLLEEPAVEESNRKRAA